MAARETGLGVCGGNADGEGGGEMKIWGSIDVFTLSDVRSSKGEDEIGGVSIVAWMGDTGLLARREEWILYAGRAGSRGGKSSFCLRSSKGEDGIGGMSIVAWTGDVGLLARREGWMLYAGRGGSRGAKSSFCRGDSGRDRMLPTLV